MKTMNHPMNGSAITINRAPAFDTPHKGIRNALSQLSLLAGQTDYTTYASVAKLYKLGKQVFLFLTLHAKAENEVVFKHIDDLIPGVTDNEREDHEELEAFQHALEQQLEAIHLLAGEGQDVSDLGAIFYQNLSELHGLHLLHMLEEEREIQPKIYVHFSDEEIRNHNQEIVSKFKPEDLLTMLRFMLPAHTHRTRVGMLKGIKANAPASFFTAVMTMLEEVLTEKDMSMLKSVLN